MAASASACLDASECGRPRSGARGLSGRLGMTTRAAPGESVASRYGRADADGKRRPCEFGKVRNWERLRDQFDRIHYITTGTVTESLRARADKSPIIGLPYIGVDM